MAVIGAFRFAPAMEIKQIFAANLRRYRREARLTQEEVAARLEQHDTQALDQGYISRLEAGQYNASIETVAALASVLGIPPGKLLDPVE